MSSPQLQQPPTPSGARSLLGRRLPSVGVVLLLSLAIAALLSASGMGHFTQIFVYSLCIGFSCWLIIDGGMHALARMLQRGAAAPSPLLAQGFPGWRWMWLPVLAGVLLGPLLGNALAGWLGLQHARSMWPLVDADNRITWVLTLLAGAVAITVLSLAARLSNARAAAEHAQRAAAEHQLKLLESQLEPHMLFNTLANLRVLIASDPVRAQAMLDRLIALLRSTLQASRRPRQTLADEFSHLDDYLALMAVRMGTRLQITLQLPDELRTLQLPPLLLQPLVENSIKHGLEPKLGGGRIVVGASREDQTLCLSVYDSGVGLGSDAAAGGSGFGLQQVRERLKSVYGDAASLRLQADAQGGTRAIVHLPIES